MAESSGPPYRVVYSENIRAELRAWGQIAITHGCGLQYGAVLRVIDEKLTTEPNTWGDPLFRHRTLGLQLYRGTHSIFNVHYAVDEVNKVVYLKPFEICPGQSIERIP